MANEQQFCEHLLGALMDDLWIKRRLELTNVLSKFQSVLEDHDADQETKNRALDWFKFVQFLEAECSGAHFSEDKQWSELMNLMGISKKFNHRSVKFRELLKSRQSIEANAVQIVRLNESAQLAESIEQSLAELDQLTQKCRLEWPDIKQASFGASICNKVSESERYLRNYCNPLLSNLSLELDNQLELNKNSTRLDEWRVTLKNLSILIKLINEFLQNFKQFQDNLTHLQPLIRSINEKDNRDAKRYQLNKTKTGQQQLLQDSLRDCKLQFGELVKFNETELLCLLDQMARGAGEESKSGKASSFKNDSTKATCRAKRDKQQVCISLIKLLNVKKFTYTSDILGVKLSLALEQSKQCESTLDDLMQTIRLEFGRFYFVNDLELLTIISLDSKLIVEKNEPLICKLFNNSISGFLLDKEEKLIIGVQSPIGEQVRFKGVEPVPLKKPVNIYSIEIVRILNEMLRKLSKTLRNLFDETLRSETKAIGAPSSDLYWSLPIQLMTLLDQLRFTQRVEKALQNQEAEKIDPLLEQYELRFRQLSQADTSSQEETPMQQLKRSAAISMSVHFISTLLSLRELKSGNKVTDWAWLKLARLYLVEDSDKFGCKGEAEWQVEVRLASAKFHYKFHYLPIETLANGTENYLQNDTRPKQCYKRLISTRTSEKCHLISGQAVARLRLGASLFGPAGSGKTETIKALGQLVGCQVIVHNCDESNDSQSLERLVWGLAHTGLWGCLDEFNRLGAGTLSSLSATLEQVQTSLRQGKRTLELAGGQIRSLDEDSAFFVTLNPADSNKYRGRRQLPANFRALFLPISMVCLQVETIVSELLLVDCGQFCAQLSAKKARQLGFKLAAWLEWIRQQEVFANAQQQTCVFDLRLILVIIRRFKMLSSGASCACNESQIEELLCRSIKLELTPRLSGDECGQKEKLYESLEKLIHGGPDTFSPEANKSTQILQQLNTRQGVILVGPSGSGKSRAWRSATCNFEKQKSQINWLALNPKACHKSDLFGHFSESLECATTKSRKWHDGLFTRLVREAQCLLAQSDAQLQHQVWIVLDGSIDPDWIECLNSVLDDNHVLTLSSGERLNFVGQSPKKCIKLIFETLDTRYASPATISRLGLVTFQEPVLNQLVPNQSEEISFEQNTNQRLLLISGGSSHLARREHINQMLENKKDHLIEYECSHNSNCKHLLELLELIPLHETQKSILVLHNFDLIRPEDNWSNRSLEELIRFILEYRFYYDVSGAKKSLPNELLFIISGDTLAQINPRLRSLASKAPIELDKQNIFGPIESVPFYSLLSQSAPCVLMVVCSSISHNRDHLEQLQLSSEINFTHRFSSSTQVSQALEALQRVIYDNQKAANKQGDQVFMATECELCFMEAKQRSRLLHLLNLILIQQFKSVKFIYITQADTIDSDYRVCLTSMSHRTVGKKICKIEDQHKDPSISIESSWLREKALQVIELCSKNSKQINKKSSESFVETLFAALKRAEKNLAAQVKILSGGLKNLANFEAEIEQIKKLRQQEDAQVAEKKFDLEKLIDCIDMQLRNSSEQCKQIEQLKLLQQDKTVEIEKKSARIELELASVKPIIEASKREVSTSLRPEVINEIKSLRQPPRVIKDILDVLFILLGQSDNSWASIKSYITKNSLKDELENFDLRQRLNASLLAKLDEEIERKGGSFSREQATRASSAIVPMLNWVEAVRQYGKVLMRMEPLSEAKSRLEFEAEQISKSAGELEAKQAEIDQKIERERKELQKLRADYEEAEQKSVNIANELERAQQVRSSLTDQIERWQAKLRLYTLLSELRKMHRLCLCAAYLANYYCCNEVQLLDQVLRLLEFDSETIDEGKQSIFANILTILDNQGNENFLLKFSSANNDQLGELAELLGLRLSLMLRSRTGPIKLLCYGGKAGAMCTHIAIKRRLCVRRIVCELESEIVIVKPQANGAQEWRQAAEFGSKTGQKIIVFDLQSVASNFAPIWLEVVNFCRNFTSKSSSTNLMPKVIIICSFQLCSASLNLLGLQQIISGKEDSWKVMLEEISAKLESLFVELSEPQLSFTVANLELELEQKQKEAKEMETKLIGQLSSLKPIGQLNGTNQLGSASSLVCVLSEMHELSQELGEKIGQIERKLIESNQRRAQYAALANQSGRLYYDLIAQQADFSSPFCSLTLGAYASLVLLSKQANTKLDLEFVLAEAMRPMGCAARNALCRRVGDYFRQPVGFGVALPPFEAKRALNRAADLRSSLLGLVGELACGERERGDTRLASTRARGLRDFRLAIVLHDSKKSSPQMEIDELFMRQLAPKSANNKRLGVQYKKLYASCGDYYYDYNCADGGEMSGKQAKPSNGVIDNGWQAEVLCDIMSTESLLRISQQSNSDSAAAPAAAMVNCVCLANAHLASRWLANELAVTLERRSNKEAQWRKTLLVLVAESGAQNECPFEFNLLEFADLKCWHDELALGISDRFQLLKNLLLQAAASSIKEKSKLEEIAEELVLLHVVCQELTSCKLGGQLSWLSEQYTFGLDQLFLAGRLLSELKDHHQVEQVARDSFCNHVETIVYGAKLETAEDELLLGRLVGTFLRNSNLAKSKLDQFKRHQTSAAQDQNVRLLSELLAS